MGPFVPELISNELNLIVALLVGIGFGFVLEQAGFSSSRKLTGLFYGTDFTVLRVFFTAGITAMCGVSLLGYFGLLDLRVIFVNPLYLYSAIIGGGVMGVGFVIGGYCPGTSFCGAAIGKIDAMVFVVGGLLGAFAFGEFFPSLRELYMAGYSGDVTVGQALGIAPGVFALLLIIVAIAVFAVTTFIEKRNNPSSTAFGFPVRYHRLAAVAVLIVGGALALLPDRESHLLAKAADADYQAAHPVSLMTADELAFRILDNDPAITIIDVRDSTHYAQLSLPGAVNIPMAEMFGKEWRDVLSQTNRKKILIADSESVALDAAALMGLLGYENIAALKGGLPEFADTILSASRPSRTLTRAEADIYGFRLRAAPQLAALISERGVPKKLERRVPKVQAGCGM